MEESFLQPLNGSSCLQLYDYMNARNANDNQMPDQSFDNSAQVLSWDENNCSRLMADINVMESSANGVPEFPYYIRTTATIVCTIVLVLGTTGNLLVPIVVIKTKELRNSTNLFLINLSIADLLVLIGNYFAFDLQLISRLFD